MRIHAMNLQLFAEDGAAAAPAGGGAETGTAADTGTIAEEVRVGDTLGDGTQVTDARVAAALNRQMNRHPELRKVYGQNGRPQNTAQPADPAQRAAQVPAAQQQGEQAGNEPDDIQARWEAAKKGEFKELYGQDVQAAIQNRIKNQADASQQLTAMQPMLEVLMKKAGVESIDELQEAILNDDSLYEEEAEERGMTVEQLKSFNALEAENARLKRAEESAMYRRHIDNLVQQGEELKQTFPDFDFFKEMENEQFRMMTGPQMNMSVEQAYYAIHGKELVPQLMAYGMQRAQNQMGQTLQAQRMRPAEGAMSAKNQAAAEPALNPNSLDRTERSKLKEYVRKYGPISFDRR